MDRFDQMRPLALVLFAACGRMSFDPMTTDADAVALPSGTIVVVNSQPSTPTDVMTLDAASGHLTRLGTLPASWGLAAALAAWDANTLYAVAGTSLVEITVAPFAATIVQDVGPIGALDYDGAALVGVDNIAVEVVRFVPGGAVSRVPITGVGSNGGDLVHVSGSSYLWWPNVNGVLYALDAATGKATALGATQATPYLPGLFLDGAGALHAVTSSMPKNFAVDIDPTGRLGAMRVLCLECPTPYTMSTGDAGRVP